MLTHNGANILSLSDALQLDHAEFLDYAELSD